MSQSSEDISNADDVKLIEWILESKQKNFIRACEAELQRRIARELAKIRHHLEAMNSQ